MDKTEKELDQDELNALKSIGIIAGNWYAVSYNANQMPYAIFESKECAEAYRDKFSATSIVEPWPMIIKDLRKGKTMTEKRTEYTAQERDKARNQAIQDCIEKVNDFKSISDPVITFVFITITKALEQLKINNESSTIKRTN